MAYSHYHLPFLGSKEDLLGSLVQVVPSMVSQTRRCATGNDAAVCIVAVRNVAWCRVEGPGEFRPISWDRPWMVCNWDISLDRSLLS